MKGDVKFFVEEYQGSESPQNLATYFYNLALERVKNEIEKRFDDNLVAAEGNKSSLITAIFGSAAKEDYEIISIIEKMFDK